MGETCREDFESQECEDYCIGEARNDDNCKYTLYLDFSYVDCYYFDYEEQYCIEYCLSEDSDNPFCPPTNALINSVDVFLQTGGETDPARAGETVCEFSFFT